jgi:hypothetical protein
MNPEGADDDESITNKSDDATMVKLLFDIWSFQNANNEKASKCKHKKCQHIN